MAAATVGRDRGRRAGGDDRGGRDRFRGLEHAMELVAERDGVRFVNDSKATNVEAALAIDRELRRRARARSWAAGSRAGISGCCGSRWRPGQGGRDDRRSADRSCARRSPARSTFTKRRRSKRRSARRSTLAKPAGVVLLAPACASFDMFRDYAERGRTFKDEVARIAHGERSRGSARRCVAMRSRPEPQLGRCATGGCER